MRKLKYSFIIPHKNSPQLLNRCLQSIPKRDDLEIIVVDDRSTNYEDVKNVVEPFSYAVLYSNEGSYAGGARNTGISKAKGKWLLFADCDDYYVDGFLDELDKIENTNCDVIYFNFYKYLEGGDNKPVFEKISNYISEYVKGKLCIDYVKYRNNAPWNKMVNRQFVEKYNIRFEEQPIGNDIFFSFQIGYHCLRYEVHDVKLYNYIVYKSSQTTSNWDDCKIRTYLENKQKYNGFVEFINHKEWTHGFLYLCLLLYKSKNFERSIRILRYYFLNYHEIRRSRNKYIEFFKERESPVQIRV